MNNERLQIGYLEVQNRPTVSGIGVLLQGEAAAGSVSNVVYTTGNNVISGDNTFYGDQYIFSGADIIVSGGTFNLDIRPVVNGTGVLLSGEAAQLPETIVYTTNDQSITGLKTFRSGIRIGEYGQDSIPTIQIFDAPNGEYSTFYLEDSQLYINSANRILYHDFGKYPTGTIQTIAVIKDIENYTGFATITNLASTGSTLDTKINNLSGNSILVFGNQNISGQKTFATGIDIVNGTNPQRLRVFNSTGTNSGEFGVFGWQATGTGIGQNILVIGTQATQSGILRDVALSGRNIRIPTGDLYIGTTGAGTSRIYLSNPSSANYYQITPNTNNMTIGYSAGTAITIDANFVSLNNNLTLNSAGYLFGEGTNRYIGLRDTYGGNDTIGTNNQGFNIYKIYSGTTNGYATREFLTLGWTGTTGIIGTTIGQSGTLRNLILTGNNILMKPSGLVYFYDNNFIFNKNGTFSTTSLTNGISEFALNRGDNGYMMVFASYNGQNALTFRGNNAGGAGYGLLAHNLYVIAGGHLAFGQNQGHGKNLDQGCDLFITRDAANILSQVNGANAQQFRVYNLTGTNTGEFGLVGWQNNNFIVGAQRTQNGTLRNLTLTGANVNISSSGNTNFNNRPTVNNTGVMLSGDLNSASLSTSCGLTGNILAGASDVIIPFTVKDDPLGWWNSSTNTWSPNIPGRYYVSYQINWGTGSLGNQINSQIRKSTNTVSLAQHQVPTVLNFTQNNTAIVTMNGTTGDYLDFTCYTSSPTTQYVIGTADGAWTHFEAFRLSN